MSSYSVGSIAELIASASGKKSKDKSKLYDSNLCQVFEKKVKTNGPISTPDPYISSFSKYVPVIPRQESKPEPKVKLGNKDAAAIRIQAKQNNQQQSSPIKVKKGKVKVQRETKTTTPIGGQSQEKGEDRLNAYLNKKKEENKSARLRKKQRENRRKKANAKNKESKIKVKDSTEEIEIGEAEVDVDVEITPEQKKKAKKRKKSNEDQGQGDGDDEDSSEVISKKVKKVKKNKSISSGEGEEGDAHAKDDKMEIGEPEKKSNAELNLPKEKNIELESRTIYIGNVSVDTTKKELKKIFKSCGTIESIRFRCATPAKPNALKKIAIRKNMLHPDRSSLVAYIRFETREEAEKAVKEMSGIELDKHHLSLDLADRTTNPIQRDNSKAIFIGNLHLKTQDDELWEIFKECGPIQSVRIVRDQATGLGKGFGYINFQTNESVELALKMNDIAEVRTRTLRISRCVKKLKNRDGNSKDNVTKKYENGIEIKSKRNTFGGDRLSEIGKLKRKSKSINLGEKKKESIARQLAGISKPRTKPRHRKSQGERQRPKKGQPGKGPGPSPRKGQNYGKGPRKNQSQRPQNGHGKDKAKTKRYFSK